MRWTISRMVGREHSGKSEVHGVRKGMLRRQTDGRKGQVVFF